GRYSLELEQEPHADAAAHAPGPVARAARQAEQAARTMGKRSPAPRQQAREKVAMTPNGLKWTAAVVLAGFAGVAAPAHAQQISDARIRELIKQAADAARVQTPTTAQQPSGDTRTAVPLTLDDAVKFALDRNLD